MLQSGGSLHIQRKPCGKLPLRCHSSMPAQDLSAGCLLRTVRVLVQAGLGPRAEDVFLYSKALMRQDAPAPQQERLSPISIAGIHPCSRATSPQAATLLHASYRISHAARCLVTPGQSCAAVSESGKHSGLFASTCPCTHQISDELCAESCPAQDLRATMLWPSHPVVWCCMSFTSFLRLCLCSFLTRRGAS